MLGYNNLIGNLPRLTQPLAGTGSATMSGEILYIPLEFWFNRNAGLALPLIALVKNTEQKSINKNIGTSSRKNQTATESNCGKLIKPIGYLSTKSKLSYGDNPLDILTIRRENWSI